MLSIPVPATPSTGPQEDLLEREGLHVASVRDTRQQSSGQRLAWGRGQLWLGPEGLGVRLGDSHTPVESRQHQAVCSCPRFRGSLPVQPRSSHPQAQGRELLVPHWFPEA